MIKVIIIEDEQIAADYLEKLILGYSKELDVIKKIDSVEGALSFLSAQHPDLMFCDIHLADDISFTIFEKMEIAIPVIFTTAYDQYAIKAFKLNSIDYLLKPINKTDLYAAIDKYTNLYLHQGADLKELLKAINLNGVNYQQRFLVSTGSQLKSVMIQDVAYFYADQKMNFLVDKSGKKYIVDQSLDKLEPLLNPQLFFRINRQFIISFSSISGMVTYSKSRIKIELNPPASADTIVSTERSPEFKEWLNR